MKPITSLLTFWMLMNFWGIVQSQSYTMYRIGNSQDSLSSARGGLCLMGGASEHDEAMRWFLQAAQGGDILVLRTSGSDGYHNYMYNQLGVTLNSVTTIVCHNANCANEATLHQKIQEAEGIWFAGGDQWDYISYWRNTAVDSLINLAIQQRNIVVGGTSAGMAIQGGYYFSAENGTVTSTTALVDPFGNSVTVDSAAFMQHNYMKNVITDTHFDNPDRRGRLVTFLARMQQMMGSNWPRAIACDEYTAVCIDSNGIARVFGDAPSYNDYAYFVTPQCLGPEQLQTGQNLHWWRDSMALTVYRINGDQAGTKSFDIANWQPVQGGERLSWAVNQGNFIEWQNPNAVVGCLTPTDLEAPKADIQVYPNPCQHTLYIPQPLKAVQRYQILNLQGQLCKTWESEEALQKVDVQELPNGIYFLKMQTPNTSFSLKFVKQL